MTNKIRVGVLFGGQSGEHEVSLTSARAVMEALDREKYDVVPIGITKQGRWLAGDNTMPALEAMADPKLLPAGAELRMKHEELRTENSLLDVTDTMLVAKPNSQFSVLNSQLSI